MSVRAAFEAETRVLPLAQILATRQVTPQIRQTRKYRAIRSSIEAVGVVEPLVVHPQTGGGYLLLDGHLRLDVLKELGVAEASCLVATADEGYTYNKQINRLSTIQEHNMIR
jgi:ParB-like chromosome segregation protein Spo0J